MGLGLRQGVAVWSPFTPTAWPLKDSLGHRHPNPRQGTTPPLTECPPGLTRVKKDGHLPAPHLAGSGHRTAGSLTNGPTFETHRPKHGPGALSRPEGHQAKRMGPGPRVLGPCGWGHLAGAGLPSPGLRRQLGLPAGPLSVKVRRPAHPRGGRARGPARAPTGAPALPVEFAQGDGVCAGGSVLEPRGAGRPRAPAPAQGQPARGDSNLPLRFLPAPRPGPYARPSLLPSQAPTDGQADARTKGPAHGRPGAGLREEQVSAPTPLGARTRSALERRGPSARTAGPRASVSPGGGTTRGSAWVYRPGWDARGIRERGLPWAGGQEPGPAAWPAPSGPGAAP